MSELEVLLQLSGYCFFKYLHPLLRYEKFCGKKAIGTSLLVIALQSLSGFFLEVISSEPFIDWLWLLKVLCLAIAGVYLGSLLSHGISSKYLKKYFGYFVLVMAIYILIREIL